MPLYLVRIAMPIWCTSTALCDAVLHALGLQNFAKMQLSEIEDNIVARRNRIFLLMEEVRRLRIQRRLKVKTAIQVPLFEKKSDRKDCLHLCPWEYACMHGGGSAA